jgi:polyphosphate kinase 2 (PPK2 family)
VAKYSPIDINRFRVPPARQLSLERHDPTDTIRSSQRWNPASAPETCAPALRADGTALRAKSLVGAFIFQAMDGRGRTARSKTSRGLDPKSTQVYTFKSPSSEELKHDFMWRCMKALPERGRIDLQPVAYEEVLHLACPSGAD